jgi:hypothetical protein
VVLLEYLLERRHEQEQRSVGNSGKVWGRGKCKSGRDLVSSLLEAKSPPGIGSSDAPPVLFVSCTHTCTCTHMCAHREHSHSLVAIQGQYVSRTSLRSPTPVSSRVTKG